jgi:hypothetical protein
VSRRSHLAAILSNGAIEPNHRGQFATTFGSSTNSYFRRRRCVSLFDYRDVPDGAIDPPEPYFRCVPTSPATQEDGVAVFLLNASIYPNLQPWTGWQDEATHGEMSVPYAEVGHAGPIPLSVVDEVLCVEIEEDPSSIARALNNARQRHRQRI